MCRITASISPARTTSEDILCGSPRSLLVQAGAVKGRFQDDGWGIGFFREGGREAIIKSPLPARLNAGTFCRAAAKARSRVTLAHVRYASAPGVPMAKQVRMENTQPFSGGGFIFAHNGTLFIKDEIRSLLGKYASRIKGNGDSEVLFWQAMKMLDAYGSPAAALEAALDEIRTVWVSRRDSVPGRKFPYTGLNLFLASKDSLTVLCHAPRSDARASLMTPGWEYGRIAWHRKKNRVVFSSEPTDASPGWKKMNDPEIASASVSGGKLRLSLKRVQL